MSPTGLARVLLAAILSSASVAQALTLSSPAFSNNDVIPNQFTFSSGSQCSGSNWSPPLEFGGVPEATRSFALLVRDPDGGNWLHWLAWNIPPGTLSLAHNASAVATFSQAANGFGTMGWGGPCPPTPNHRYVFTLYALNRTFTSQPSEGELTAAAIQTATLTGTRSPSSDATWVPNYTSLWWNPAESGWGINLNHQGNILFATLFTYSSSGNAMWLVMSGGALQSDGRTFTGTLYQTTGSAFNAVPFVPLTAANLTAVGSMSVSFSSGNTASLTYTVNNVRVTKQIERQVFGQRPAICQPASASRASLSNYQDLWWNAAESGWGLNLTHQGNTLFGTLFTYDAAGAGMWLVMSAGTRQADGTYLGDLYRTTGPAFNAQPFVPITSANLTRVGDMRLRFASGESAMLDYSVSGASVTKQIVRQVFASGPPACVSALP